MTIGNVQRINSILEVQEAVVNAIASNTYFATKKVQVLAENRLDIAAQLKQTLGRLGVVVTVQTPRLDFAGKDGLGHPVWSLEELQVFVVEIPITNRGRAGASTALDTALQVAESLNEAGIVPVSIQQGEESGYILVTVTGRCSVHFRYDKITFDPAPPGETTNQPAEPPAN